MHFSAFSLIMLIISIKDNLKKIAEEFGKEYLIVNKLILEMNLFSLEDK